MSITYQASATYHHLFEELGLALYRDVIKQRNRAAELARKLHFKR